MIGPTRIPTTMFLMSVALTSRSNQRNSMQVTQCSSISSGLIRDFGVEPVLRISQVESQIQLLLFEASCPIMRGTWATMSGSCTFGSVGTGECRGQDILLPPTHSVSPTYLYLFALISSHQPLRQLTPFLRASHGPLTSTTSIF